MRHLVGRHGIALSPAARRQRWVDGQRQRRCVGALTGCQQSRREGAAGARAVAIGPQLVMPVGDLARRVASGLEHGTVCRTQGAVRQLVGTRPQHAHRLAGAAQGHQHGIKSHIVSAVVAIAARTLDVVNQDVGFGHRHGLFGEGFDDIVAQVVNALAVRPHLQLAAVPLRQSARWTNGRMRQIRLEINRLMMQAVSGPFGITPLHRHRGLVRGGGQETAQIVHVGQGRAGAPLNQAGQAGSCRIGIAL